MPPVVTRLVRPASEISVLNRAYVLVGVADGSFQSFLILYLLQRGLGPAAIGITIAASSATWLVASLGVAYLADHRSRPERLVVVSALSAAMVALGLALPGSAILPAVAAVTLSLVRGPLTLLDPIALSKLRGTNRTDYARIRLRMSAGWAVSVIVTGAIYQAVGYRFIPFIYAPLSVLAAAFIWYSLPSRGPGEGVATATTVEAATKVTKIPVALAVFLVSTFLLGASLAATQNFLLIQINVLGGGAFLVGVAAALQAFTEVPTMGSIHVLSARFSHRALFTIGCAIYVVLFIGWALVTSALLAALLKLFAGMAYALTFVAGVMIANELAPPRLRATSQALVKSVTFGLAPIFGAFGGGVVYGTLGARPMFLLSTVAVGAAGLIALFASRPAPRAESQPRKVEVGAGAPLVVPERP